ncbi:uncharacterized protein G2W53_040243 [Senna tora]|uniref:Uncharacterized protein n=1 Tax=Senna tora TaxID=362788 RepID=A0A834SUN9_9FABA|nr:uncharacterized protein G2W53_040243 [Senna tora]
MSRHTFHAITSPIRGLNPLGFTKNAKQSFSLTCPSTRLNRCFISSFEIDSRFSIHNVFQHDLTHIPCNHKSHSSIKSTRIPKYNAKRSIQKRFSYHIVFRLDLKNLPFDHEPDWSITSARTPKYNVKRTIPCDHEHHSSGKSPRIPKYNAKRSFSLTCATIRLNFCFLSSFEIQSRFSIQNVLRHDLTQISCDHGPHSSRLFTRILKYNAKRSFSLTSATTRLNLCFLSSFEIQSRFSIHNGFRHDLTHLPCNHESHSSIKSTRISKYNAKRSI